MPQSSLGARIRQAREYSGLTQRNLAEKLFVTQQAVAKWESGMAVPQLDKIEDIAKVLHISTELLLYDDCDMTPFIRHDLTEEYKNRIYVLKQKQKEQGFLDFKDKLSLRAYEIELENDMGEFGPPGKRYAYTSLTEYEHHMYNELLRFRPDMDPDWFCDNFAKPHAIMKIEQFHYNC